MLGLVLLYASIRKVEFGQIREALRSAHWTWALLALAGNAAFIAAKAWRWKNLLRFSPDVRFSELHGAVYIGLAMNFLVAHVGEFLRSAIIARKRDLAMSAVFASVVVERILDFIAMLFLLAIVFASAPSLPDIVEMAGIGAALIVVIATSGLFALLHPPQWLCGLAGKCARLLPARTSDLLTEQLRKARLGLESVKDLRLMTVVLVTSVLQWTLVVSNIWCSAAAVGESVSLLAAFVVFVIIIAGLTLPNSPLQIGTTQLAFVLGLGIDHVSASTAIAASLIYTVCVILQTMIVGGVLLIARRRPVTLRART